MNTVYASAKESPHASLHDVYQASRALGVASFVAMQTTPDGKVTEVPVENNGDMLRSLRGAQTVAEFIDGKDLTFSSYYEQERGSRPALDKVEKVWNELGYDVKFVHAAEDNAKKTPFEEDFMKLSHEQAVELLRRYFDA